MKRGKEKLVIVTGASRGLGRAMTDRFIELGHTVSGCGRSLEHIRDLKGRYGPPHRFVRLDVTDDAAVRKWARAVVDRLGAPDLLVNNAGLANRPLPLWEIPHAEFVRVIQSHIVGTAAVIRHFVPAMIERGSGVIVNFSSGWGRSVSPHVAPYCAAKWAIEGLTKALAQELPNGLAAVAYSPGMVNTDMLENYFGTEAADYPSPAEWAEQAVPELLKLGPRHNGKSL